MVLRGRRTSEYILLPRFPDLQRYCLGLPPEDGTDLELAASYSLPVPEILADRKAAFFKVLSPTRLQSFLFQIQGKRVRVLWWSSASLCFAWTLEALFVLVALNKSQAPRKDYPAPTNEGVGNHHPQSPAEMSPPWQCPSSRGLGRSCDSPVTFSSLQAYVFAPRTAPVRSRPAVSRRTGSEDKVSYHPSHKPSDQSHMGACEPEGPGMPR